MNDTVDKNSSNDENRIYTYKLYGNVLHNKIESTTPLSYRELFYLAQVRSGSNLENFKLDEYADDQNSIYIPRYEVALYWNEIKSAQDFVSFGIDKKYAKILYSYYLKNKGNHVTWNDIESIKGIGQKTFLKLKNFLILE
ncbi:hypothetical protein SAM46_00815 [Mycoplasmopsis verecunda]|nr:hypothetical protein [Mycoplasmopsis verecunda]WPB54691.1 hypothetical protein SAM46_00815 [Mycoplasmopsis verecunda]